MLGWSAGLSNSLPIHWGLFLHFLSRQCILAHIGFHSLLHSFFVSTSIYLLIVLLAVIPEQHCVETHMKETLKKKIVTAHYMDCFDILISPRLSTVLESEGQWCEPISVKC